MKCSAFPALSAVRSSITCSISGTCGAPNGQTSATPHESAARRASHDVKFVTGAGSIRHAARNATRAFVRADDRARLSKRPSTRNVDAQSAQGSTRTIRIALEVMPVRRAPRFRPDSRRAGESDWRIRGDRSAVGGIRRPIAGLENRSGAFAPTRDVPRVSAVERLLEPYGSILNFRRRAVVPQRTMAASAGAAQATTVTASSNAPRAWGRFQWRA